MLVGMELDHPYANVVDTNTSDECIEETMNTSFYSVTKSVDTEDTDYMEEDTVLESQPHSQNKDIVFESCLDRLLRFCPQCNHPIEDISKSMQGSLLSVRSKKKATKIKLVSVNVHLLSKFSTTIPNRKKRKNLEEEGRMTKLSFYHVSTEQTIKSQILTAFGINNFRLLECNNGKLEMSTSQKLTAEIVIERRGACI